MFDKVYVSRVVIYCENEVVVFEVWKVCFYTLSWSIVKHGWFKRHLVEAVNRFYRFSPSLWILVVSSLTTFKVQIGTMGLWSVLIVTSVCPKMYISNFEHTHAIPSASNSIDHHFNSALIRLLDIQVTHLEKLTYLINKIKMVIVFWCLYWWATSKFPVYGVLFPR